MIRDTITTLALAAGPLLLAWIGALVRRYIAQRLYVAQTRVLERRSRAVTAESQGSVDALKDPSKPGEWSTVMAARVRAEAINRVRALEPLACQTVLEALDGDEAKLSALIGTYVEESVRAMRQWEATPATASAPASALANELETVLPPSVSVPVPLTISPSDMIPPGASAQRGHIRASLLGVVLLVSAGLLTTRCTASAVETQSTAADRIARTLNAVEPRWIAESQRRAIAAAHDLCSLDAGPCDRAAAHAAADAVLSQWEPVVVAWDAFAASHDVWRTTLETCRSRHDAVCSPSVEAAGALLRAVGAWRCAVRAVGHAEYDPLPGEPACADGGAL